MDRESLSSGEQQQKMFTSRLNTLTGKIDWELLDEDYDYQQELARAGFADMLHDFERNRKYYEGLRKVIGKLKSENKRVHVLDIGTGTGLLSMMAVRCGADKVTACEAFRPMIQVAKNCIAANGMSDKIHIIEKRSTEIVFGEDMSEKANVLVTEVFDTELIGEGAISTYTHALENLLTKDCYVVPDNAVMYIQVVESELCRDWNWLNLDKFNIRIPDDYRNPAGDSILDLQLTQFNEFTPLTKPLVAFEFSFSGKKQLLFEEKSRIEAEALTSGSTHAIFMWWVLRMDYEGEILLSCAPKWAHHEPDNMQWRDHWMQAVYYPKMFTEVKPGEKFYVECNHDEYSLWFDVNKTKIEKTQEEERSLGITLLSRNRLGQLNDIKRNENFIQLLKKYENLSKNILIVNEDLSMIPFLAATKANFNKVLVLESNNFRKRFLQSLIKENKLEGKIKIIERSFHELESKDLCDLKIDLVLSECAFNYGLLPWDNLYYYFGIEHFKLLGLNKETHFLPMNFKLKVVAVELENLDKIRSPVKNTEGFDITEFDKVILKASDKSDGFLEPHPLWEYPSKPLSQVHELFSIEFCKTIQEAIRKKITIPIRSDGLLNGIVIWHELQFDSESEDLKCGLVEPAKYGASLEWNKNYKQAVQILDKKYEINEANRDKFRIDCDICFDHLIGKFNIEFKIVEIEN